MKITEALKIINGVEELRGTFPEDGNEVEEALIVVKESLKKQIPRKTEEKVFPEDVKVGNVVFKAGTKVHRCPECLSPVTASNHFCSKCGQALIW